MSRLGSASAYELERALSDNGSRSWASSETARRTMVANRRANTKPELTLRSALHRRGLRFRCELRLDLGAIRVRPDVVFTRRRVAVFVDGCYWHGCPEHGELPKANREYWSAKINGNRQRDRRVNAALLAAGWLVVRMWEHEDPEQFADAISDSVRER
jgi:DNA mismatch endonuclease, patch repair protein